MEGFVCVCFRVIEEQGETYAVNTFEVVAAMERRVDGDTISLRA